LSVWWSRTGGEYARTSSEKRRKRKEKKQRGKSIFTVYLHCGAKRDNGLGGPRPWRKKEGKGRAPLNHSSGGGGGKKKVRNLLSKSKKKNHIRKNMQKKSRLFIACYHEQGGGGGLTYLSRKKKKRKKRGNRGVPFSTWWLQKEKRGNRVGKRMWIFSPGGRKAWGR